ncbi:ComEA family DNA-binding protein [Pseudomonas soli]|uniref:ComEA family DNA-binding protein n=1 Tax=Pseudomonas soli TaxID=1306993 RepID=UPI0037FF7FA1
MRNTVLTYLLLPLFTCLSFSLPAAAQTTVNTEPTAIEVPANALAAGNVNLNRADAATLQRELKGIGKAKAEAIIAYRETHGAFQSVDELLEIKGIGSALLEQNRDRLVVD